MSRITTQYSICTRTVQFQVVSDDYAKILTDDGWDDRSEFDERVMHMSQQSAQELIDSLWGCGVRPTEGTGSAGALKATQDHLQDMRKLVFDNTLRVDNG